MIPFGIEYAAENLARIRKERERLYESELSGPDGHGEYYVITTNEPGKLEALAERRGMKILWDMRGNPDYEFTPDGKNVSGNTPDYDGPIEEDE